MFLDFISDMGVTDQKRYDRWYRKWNRESSISGMLFRKRVLLEVSYFARNKYEIKTVTLGLRYIEDLIFLENDIIWFWNPLDVKSTVGSV